MLARGLRPVKKLIGDLRFVKDLDYWGYAESKEDWLRQHPTAEKDGRKKVILAVLPALVAVIRDINGRIIGISQTYLDEKEPRKWVWGPESHIPPKHRDNAPKKIRGDKKHGLIRLGMITERFAMAEGWENSVAWWQLARGPEDISIGASVDLGNLAGGRAGTEDHPTLKNSDGRPIKVATGAPNMDEPGAILPSFVKELILLGDGDSEPLGTMRLILTGARRYAATIPTVSIDMSPKGFDWNSYANALAEIPEAVAA